MARTKRSKIAARYNAQLEQAKEAFKQRTGKKIARGFSDSKEAKRIERNKTQALYRYEKKQEVQTTGRKLGKIIPAPGEVIEKQIKDPKLGNVRASNEADGMFFTVLTNKGANRGEGPALAMFRENEIGQAKPVKGVIIDSVNNTKKIYSNDFAFSQGLGALYRAAASTQKATGNYPFVSVVEVETDTEVFVTVRMYNPGETEE